LAAVAETAFTVVVDVHDVQASLAAVDDDRVIGDVFASTTDSPGW